MKVSIDERKRAESIVTVKLRLFFSVKAGGGGLGGRRNPQFNKYTAVLRDPYPDIRR